MLGMKLRQARRLVPVVVLLALAVHERESLACELAAPLGLDEIAPRVFVDPALPATERAKFLALLSTGQARVAAFYGSYDATPIIIAGTDLKRLAAFTQNSYACTHYFVGGASVVFGPDGLNEDVVSHELAHAQIFSRLGWWRTLTALPTWFDEGLAMQFDARDRFGEAAYAELAATQRLVKHASIATVSSFFDADAVNHYVQVRHDVAVEWRRRGPEAMRERVAKLARGEALVDFE